MFKLRIICLVMVFAVMEISVEAKGSCDFHGHIYKTGEDFTIPGECLKYTCNDDGSIGALTCPSAGVKEGCKIVKSAEKDYPQCCEIKFECA